jgi:uncharacterized membrane protein YdbT with pleckstrin-like domain
VVISRRLLNDGEHVVLSTRTHVKALTVPVVVLLVVAGAAGYATSVPDGAHAGLWRLLTWLVALVVLLRLVVVPFLRWWTTTYTFTDRRLITRTGILSRSGHDVPMNRISDISYEKSLLDRVLGCGTLVVSDASETGRVELTDIPRVEEAQLAVSEALFADPRDAGRARDRWEHADDGT